MKWAHRLHFVIIFKWGDASNITLSWSFDNFSFHGDTTFAVTVQSVQMHITAKICGGNTKHQSWPDRSCCWGEGFPALKDNRTWLEQRWFQGPEGCGSAQSSRTLQADAAKLTATNTFLSIYFAVVANFSFPFVQPVFMCARKRSPGRRGTGSALQERICAGDLPAGGTMRSRHADFCGLTRTFLSPPANTAKFSRHCFPASV